MWKNGNLVLKESFVFFPIGLLFKLVLGRFLTWRRCRSREYQINGSLRWLHVRWASPARTFEVFPCFRRNTSRNATEWMSPVWWLVFNGLVVSYSGKTWASDAFSKTVIFASLVKDADLPLARKQTADQRVLVGMPSADAATAEPGCLSSPGRHRRPQEMEMVASERWGIARVIWHPWSVVGKRQNERGVMVFAKVATSVQSLMLRLGRAIWNNA